MTMSSQDEIVSNAKTVTKGLEALRQEHESILGPIVASLLAVTISEAISDQVDNLTLPLIMISVLNITQFIAL